MIWLFFKNCRKTKNKPTKSDKIKRMNNKPNKILRELLPRLDVFDYLDCNRDENVTFVTDTHFACLSVIDTGRRVKEKISEVTEDDQDDLENSMETAMVNSNRCAKVTEKHLKTLQCPFTWDSEPDVSKTNIVNRIESKYGIYNTSISPSRDKFSFERYVSNLIISYGLSKKNLANDKLINMWAWLDELDEKNEPFYLSIKDGLKHIVMSTLCHVLYTQDRGQCRQLYEMITRFSSMSFKSKAAVYGIQAAVCIEIGGEALQNAVHYAKQACELDSNSAYWNYFHSIALTAHRQYQDTYKSCPTDVEFDAIQHAIILVNEPNPYFNLHRMNLLKNKILYHYYYNNANSNKIVLENSSQQIQQDFRNIIELIKEIVSVQPEDPHLIVQCAKSLLTLPYLNQDNIYLAKQIIVIAVNMGYNDYTVIEAIEESIDVYRKLVDIYKEMSEKKIDTDSINTQNHINQEDHVDHTMDHMDHVNYKVNQADHIMNHAEIAMDHVEHVISHEDHAIDHVDHMEHVIDHKDHATDLVNHVEHVIDHEDHAIEHVNHIMDHADHEIDHMDHVDHVIDHEDHVTDPVNHVDHVMDHDDHAIDHVDHVARAVDRADHLVQATGYMDHIDQENKENNLDNDLLLVVKKHEKGSNVMLDLINLNNKYDGVNKWKIMAQICSYSILFKGAEHLLFGVDKFMTLINDKAIANSETVMNHKSIFIKDHSKVFNLAELVCNEIKLAITFSKIKNPDEIQSYLEQLTKIMEVCQLKSKKVNPVFTSELLEGNAEEEQQTVPQSVDVIDQQNSLPETKQIESL